MTMRSSVYVCPRMWVEKKEQIHSAVRSAQCNAEFDKPNGETDL